ncbi:SafA/ExsA family spore coat assembly protein, partial [Neobacillus niacini]
MKIHIVQKGDTLWKIAKKYGVNFEELKKMNSQLSNPDMIMPGMKIKVPTSGGTIKKEVPMGTKPGATINLGAKKEMPIAGQPFTKEKPKEMPIKTAPKKEVPIKEAPIKEAPIKVVPVPIPVPIPAKEKPVKEIPIKEAPIKEAPIKEVPIKEVPIKEAPIKEVPKTPYTPKMPLQIIPEIDINNYYLNNMTNIEVKQPKLPLKPTNILPEVKVPQKENPVMHEESPMYEQPQMQMPQDYCVPVTPVMPGSGFCPPPPTWCPPPPCPPMSIMPYPQVQGAAMQQMPNMFPAQSGPMPGVAGAEFMQHGFDDESSAFMPQLPLTNPMQGSYMEPTGYGQMQGMGQMPMGSQMQGMGQMPMGSQMPGMGQMPMGGQMQGASQMPYFDESPEGMHVESPTGT